MASNNLYYAAPQQQYPPPQKQVPTQPMFATQPTAQSQYQPAPQYPPPDNPQEYFKTGAPPVSFHQNHSDTNVLSFQNCHFTVKDKHILKGVSATVKAGEVLAIMGPSGAGKTVLMNLLTNSTTTGKAEGDVTLNGHRITTSVFREHCCYVAKEENLWTFLTCRESIMYTADLSLNLPNSQKTKIVDGIINKMGLDSCQNTRVGNQFFKGLSGGQKRRLSLAIALVKSPAVMFLDEPTSGLDSAAAAGIMSFLKELATETKVIIVCTIHQPSTEVFHGFDSSMVLSDGRIAYCGKAGDSIKYLDKIGKPMPEHHNPAEFFLDLVNKDFYEDPREVDTVLDAWAKHEKENPVRPPDSRDGLPAATSVGTSLGKQIFVQLKRQFVISLRDPILYIGRAIMFVICGIFFSLVYITARVRSQDQIISRMFLMMWYLAVPNCMGVIAVFALNTEFSSVKREIKDGMYNPFAYVVGNFFLQIPYMILLAIASMGVSAYAISNFYVPNLGLMIILYTCTLWSFEQFAQAFAYLFKNFLIGMLLFMMVWFSSFLFAGFFVPGDKIPWPLRVFVWILPLRWAISSLAKTEFMDTEFKDAYLDPTKPSGFSCEAWVGPTSCFGHTGPQVLDSLGATFAVFSSTKTFGKDVGIICCIGFTMKVISSFLFWFRTLDGRPPQPRRETV